MHNDGLPFAVVGGLVLFILVMALALCGGCATPQEQLESFRIEVGHTHADQDFGKRDGESDEWYIGGSWAPFRTRPNTVIIVTATHAAAEVGLPPGDVQVPVGASPEIPKPK